MREDATAADGSPVGLYRRVPAAPELTPLLDALPPGASTLDLGCGAGRLANLLARRGHEVVGVDASAAMLAHVDAAVAAVEARIEGLDLGRDFDAVVLASNLVNVVGEARRRAYLDTCARHVATGGSVYLQRLAPAWASGPDLLETRMGDVLVTVEVLERDGDELVARAAYRLAGRAWTHEFRVRVLDDRALDTALAAAGLARDATLDAAGAWIRARPAPG